MTKNQYNEKWVAWAKNALKDPSVSEDEKKIIREELDWQERLRVIEETELRYPCVGCGVHFVHIEGDRCPHCRKWHMHDLAVRAGQSLDGEN